MPFNISVTKIPITGILLLCSYQWSDNLVPPSCSPQAGRDLLSSQRRTGGHLHVELLAKGPEKARARGEEHWQWPQDPFHHTKPSWVPDYRDQQEHERPLSSQSSSRLHPHLSRHQWAEPSAEFKAHGTREAIIPSMGRELSFLYCSLMSGSTLPFPTWMPNPSRPHRKRKPSLWAPWLYDLLSKPTTRFPGTDL